MILNLRPIFLHFYVHKRNSAKTVNSPLATQETTRELQPKWVSQLFLISLPVTRHSAIGQFFLLPQVTVPDVFAKVNSTQSPSRFWSGELNALLLFSII